MQEQLRLLRPFLRGLPIIIVAMVIGVIAAKKYLSYVTPMYESTCKLKLADTHPRKASMTGSPSACLWANLSEVI